MKKPRSRARTIDPSSLDWMYPAEALQKLDGFAHLVGIDRQTQSKPIPAKYEHDILGRLTRDLFPDGTTEHLAQGGAELTDKDRLYLSHLVRSARSQLELRLAQEPETLLGFLTETREKWVQILTATWIVPDPSWRMVPRQSG